MGDIGELDHEIDVENMGEIDEQRQKKRMNGNVKWKPRVNEGTFNFLLQRTRLIEQPEMGRRWRKRQRVRERETNKAKEKANQKEKVKDVENVRSETRLDYLIMGAKKASPKQKLVLIWSRILLTSTQLAQFSSQGFYITFSLQYSRSI